MLECEEFNIADPPKTGATRHLSGWSGEGKDWWSGSRHMESATVKEKINGSRGRMSSLGRKTNFLSKSQNPPLVAVSAGWKSMLWLPGMGASNEHRGAMGAVGAVAMKAEAA